MTELSFLSCGSNTAENPTVIPEPRVTINGPDAANICQKILNNIRKRLVSIFRSTKKGYHMLEFLMVLNRQLLGHFIIIV